MSVVGVDWLLPHLDDPGLVIADVRWTLSGPSGRSLYDEGHIPGAHFVDLDRELAAPAGAGGRHPLPEPADFARVLSRLGLREGGTLVAYDAGSGAIAARLWWLLRYHRVAGGAVLDGGFEAWRAAGGPLSTVEPAPSAAPLLPLHPDPNRIVDAETVDALRADPRALLLDARAPERFAGREEPIDPRAGHIPGARSAPFADNLAHGKLRPVSELVAHYTSLGAFDAETVVAYCGSGVTACHHLWALDLAGRPDAKLYPGSWSEWSSQAHRPIESDVDS